MAARAVAQASIEEVVVMEMAVESHVEEAARAQEALALA